MAVNEDGISILDLHSMQPLVRYPYDSVVTFGGCQEDFMLVLTSDTASEAGGRRLLADSDRASSEESAGTSKLLFNAGKPQVNKHRNFCWVRITQPWRFQILQITLLIADYMNMIGKTAPGTLTSTPLATPKSRGCSRSSSRARGQLTAQQLNTAPNTPKPEQRSSKVIIDHRRKKSLMMAE